VILPVLRAALLKGITFPSCVWRNRYATARHTRAPAIARAVAHSRCSRAQTLRPSSQRLALVLLTPRRTIPAQLARNKSSCDMPTAHNTTTRQTCAPVIAWAVAHFGCPLGSDTPRGGRWHGEELAPRWATTTQPREVRTARRACFVGGRSLLYGVKRPVDHAPRDSKTVAKAF
jgi:hypothetical protein